MSSTGLQLHGAPILSDEGGILTAQDVSGALHPELGVPIFHRPSEQHLLDRYAVPLGTTHGTALVSPVYTLAACCWCTRQ